MSTVYLEHRDALHVAGAQSQAEIEAAVKQAAGALASCDALIISAGAGMGVDSGLPDFRGSTRLWMDRSVAMSYEDMSDDKWFKEDSEFAWGVNYTQMILYRRVEPHNGFAVLLRWVKDLGKPFYVFTSNIDGHFEKAGFPEDKIISCHGGMHNLQCTERACRGLAPTREDEVWSADCIPDNLESHVDPNTLRFRDPSVLDASCFHCPRCGRLARPNVWFCHDRNYVPQDASIRRRQAYNEWLEAIHEAGKRLVVVECGAGMAIPTVRIEGEDAVAGAGTGSLLIRMNPKDTRVPPNLGVGIPLGAREGVALIDAALALVSCSPISPPVSSGRFRASSRGASCGGKNAAGAVEQRQMHGGSARNHLGVRANCASPSVAAAKSNPRGSGNPQSNTRHNFAKVGATVARSARAVSGEDVSLANVLAEFGLASDPLALRTQLLERLRPLQQL